MKTQKTICVVTVLKPLLSLLINQAGDFNDDKKHKII
jgi:hypothetical protein